MYKDQGCILGFSEAPLTLFICVHLYDLRPESGKYVFKNQMKGNQVIVAYKVLNVCLALLKWRITLFNPQSSLTGTVPTLKSPMRTPASDSVHNVLQVT